MRFISKTIFILLCSFTLLANTQTRDIFIYQYGEPIGRMTVEEFEALIKGAEETLELRKSESNLKNIINSYKKIDDSEKRGSVKLELIDTPYLLESTEEGQDVYKARFNIVWTDSNGDKIKQFELESKVIIESKKADGSIIQYSQWRIYYRNISEVGFPIMVILGILLIIL